MANVNVPTNMAQKEKDVNQKLQLYGIYSAFANGKVPSNKQIDVAMNSALASRAFASPSKKLSREGQELVADLKKVIQEAKILLLTKNEGNLLQDFIWEAQDVDGGNAGVPGAPISKGQAQQHGDQAVDSLKTLGKLIISNGQFRKLLSDGQVLIRDMFGDAAQNAANKINPDQEQLDQIDEPAEDNTWHDVPSRDGLKQQARSVVDKNKPFSRQEAKEVAQESKNRGENQPDNESAGREGAKHAYQQLKSKAQDNVPDENKDSARNAKDATVQNTKNYIGKKMPKERRDQTIHRLKKMIVEIQGHPDYQRAITTLLDLAEEYKGHSRSLAGATSGQVKEAHGDSSLQTVEQNLKTLIERFANYTSMDDFFDSLNQVYRDADQDPKLKGWFRRMDTYIRKCLKEQGYILKDSSTEEWNNLSDEGEFLFRDRYRDHTDRITDELKFLADQFDADPMNKSFGDAVQKLFLDLGNDENGQPTFKPHLVKDLTEVIIPGIFENTRYVPIPRIEVSDPMIDLVVENLVIESNNLFPNAFEFSTDNYFRMGRRDYTSKRDNKIMISAAGIQCDLRDVAYYVKKKQGFPSITDKGVMDIILAGSGFSFKLAARNAQPKDRRNFFVVETVDVTISNLAIKIKKSNHKLLFSIAKGLLLKVMKPVIQKAVEKQIKSQFEHWDEVLYGIYKEANTAKERAKKNPEEAQNMYQQYTTAIQNKVGQKKKKAEEASSDMKVNVAITKHDSMFKNISLPGGISTKATEYRDLAAKGDRWESPVFGIGSARETSDLPHPQKVTRKHHNTASGQIRGGDHPNAQGNQSSGYDSSNTGYGSQDNYNMSSGAGGYATTVPVVTSYTTGGGVPGYGATSGYTTGTAAYPIAGATAYDERGLGGIGQANSAGFGNQVDEAFNQGTQSSTMHTGEQTGHTAFYDNVTKH